MKKWILLGVSLFVLLVLSAGGIWLLVRSAVHQVQATGTRTAAVKMARAEVELYQTATYTYEADVGDFPTESQGLQALVKQPEGVDGWRGPYLKEISPDPWGHPYQFRIPGRKGAPFEIWSFGPDGKDGTADDIRLSEKPSM